MTAKKLLVADDSVTIQKVIRLALSNEGYEIQAVSDGSNAIQQISVFRPDIVLIDVSLPGKNAFELKRAANQHPDLKRVRFILMSSAFERVDEVQASEVEFHARLTKPFDPAHLREILIQALATQQTPSPMEPHTSAEDDIRQLTESTIRISGLDHFKDSEQQEPLLPPQAEPVSASTELRNHLLYQEGLALSRENTSPPAPAIDDLGWSVQEPILKPPRAVRREEMDTSFPMENMSTEPDDQYGQYSTPHPAYKTPPSDFAPPPGFPPPFPPPSYKPSIYEPPTPEALAVSEMDIERLVAEKVTEKLEEALRKLTQAVLPDVVERVVKEEIRRLLSEQH